ncbi:Fph type histidine kinase [Russula earlei]|uniref:Fph type histidine kinase n=1 Tax=Russula earlei TaxID=71964 RepID=A0ACC0UNC0_9AGAM|nr:Fph type histidine kinase [Russula earlei]
MSDHYLVWPSPPPANPKLAPGRSDVTTRRSHTGTRVGRRRPDSFGATMTMYGSSTLDWSTSYQAGSSSSASGLSTDDDETDDDAHTVIDRRGSVSVETRNSGGEASQKLARAPSPPPRASSSDGSKPIGRTGTLSRRTFTRSRSPAPRSLGLNGIMPQPPPLPSPTAFLRPRAVTPAALVLPGTLSITLSAPWTASSSDDGLISGLVLGPLITSALYYVALKLDTQPRGTPHPPFWHIEAPWRLSDDTFVAPLQALVLSRRNAVDLGTLCSTTLLIHVCASHWYEWRHRRHHRVSEGERGSVPRSEVRKGWLYTIFTFLVCAFLLGLRFALDHAQVSLWRHLSYWEVASSSVFFQFSLYIAVRLAHGGFTLGELGLVVFGATALFTELVNLTVARIWPVTTPYIKTYRLPTPLLIYQLALIPGSLLTGFLLSPLLTLSRHIAQRPVRRLRFPQQKQAHRRALAVGFYLGVGLIVGGLIGIWTRWLLRGRDPWLWVILWLLEGPLPWTRPALLAYWAALGGISVWGWNRQLARSRRFRPRLTTCSEPAVDSSTVAQLVGEPTSPVPGTSLTSSAVSSASSAVSAMFPTVGIPHLPTDLGLGASEWLDAADRRVPTLGLNARRKFFHALAVVMFVPGVAADPAFTHLAFSGAFALFVFAEYVRYFALYPFGAAVHVFMSEFLDAKDSGTAVLSHFYLLTGCAGAVWFEAPSRLMLYTGILTVGVGDAVASIVGKRVGRYKWSPTTPKTLEGSVGFTLSVVAFAWALRVCGLVEEFSTVRYGTIVGLGSVLEAMSGQNDNIILPVYMWSTLAIGLMDNVSSVGLAARPVPVLPLPHAPLPLLERVSVRAQHPPPPSDLNQITIHTSSTLNDPSLAPHLHSKPHPHSYASSRRDFDLATDPPHKGLRPKSSYHQSLLNLRDELHRTTDSASLPRALDMASSAGTDPPSMAEPSEYDWASFIASYALGRWEPHKAPPPPRSSVGRPSSAGSPPDVPSDPHILASTALPAKGDTPPQTISPPSTASSTPTQSSSGSFSSGRVPSTSRRGSAVNVASSSIPHRLRSSFGDIRSSTGARLLLEPPPTLPAVPAVPHADATTTAAALRWAAARINIAPLALPSPEHELTDPFRNARTAIPGLNPLDVPLGPLSPRHRQRIGSFWEGLSSTLSSVQGSPPSTPPTADSSIADHAPPSASTMSASPPYVTPASVPLSNLTGHDDDYFGVAASMSPEPTATVPNTVRQYMPPEPKAPQTVPIASRHVNFTRQTSSPLPDKKFGPSVEGPSLARPVDAGSARTLKEEATFLELGYLAPPYPPDELERRRALYQFNIWNTGPDINFERIEHLTKLVFNTKTVIISLIDVNEQYVTVAWGFQEITNRHPSTCSMAGMSSPWRSSDEPMVVPDTHADWRFANNPLVTGPPRVRFYAGAPLRTQEGFNVGTLAIMDDAPRVEFSPRQRHTLKEFAAIAMREMELWRDKIQLRIRDRIQTSMEQFTRECLEIDSETSSDTDSEANQRAKNPLSMDRVYQRAAKLVKKTLDVEGSLVMDMSHGEVLETVGAEAVVSVNVHGAEDTTTYQIQGDACVRIWDMFLKYPDGRVFEALVPAPLRPFVPNGTQYALLVEHNFSIGVPIFNIDKRPFAMLCAYNSSEHGRRYLEGHELSYLRAIGVIILSAVLKRRMTLADKAKSLFISNISHELRTPLHGILAAAELLSDTQLNHTQSSFLQTVQACGTSLVETVNHVLDFTKLSGNSKAGGVEHVIRTTKIDVLQLIEEAVEGSWIGHRARMFTRQQESEIGSLYAPPRQDRSGKKQVEIVIEIGDRKEGWLLKLEKGGIRRVLMNVFGNSLKFTTDGYVHVIIRQLPPTPDLPPNKVKLELAVIDTGKNQLFHPFSQENPMQTGTGLGLAIVNSIVQSKGVDGKVDVWSAENVGTEIKVTFSAELTERGEPPLKVSDTLNQDNATKVSLVGFDDPHRGVQLLRRVLSHYLVSWWDFQIAPPGSLGDIVIANEDLSVLQLSIEQRDIRRPFLLLTFSRGERHLTATVTEFERLGGFCRILYKPGGPSRLRQALKLCIHALKMSRRSSPSPGITPHSSNPILSPSSDLPGGVARRNSEEPAMGVDHPDVRRPSLGRRSITVHPIASWSRLPTSDEEDDVSQDEAQQSLARSLGQLQSPTIPVGDTGDSLLRSSIGALGSKKNVRVLVVEDNSILRNLLTRWLSSKGYEFREAVDGHEGVHLFESDGQFDVILLDLSMPVLDGYGATVQIRKIEASRSGQKSHILALTGMSSLEDKRKAFEAGVDGYLVKPVAFKTLSDMFSRLGII